MKIETRYVLIYPDGSFVGIDQASGGYPYPLAKWCSSVVQFLTIKAAGEYMAMFPGEHFRIGVVETEIKVLA